MAGPGRRPGRRRAAPGPENVASRESFEPFTIEAEDGYVLAARRLVSQPDPAAVVVINGAVAVSQRFYMRFAEYMATNGFAVVTYDYRGVGASRPASLRGLQASFGEWALDCSAALAAAREMFPGVPLVLLGHSFGGVLGALTPQNRHLDAAVSVSAQLSYYKDWADGERWKIYLQWHVLVPLITRLFGYFPGRGLRVSEDLPASFVRDWHARRKHEDWRTQMEELGIRAYPEQLRCPVLAITASDDPICTERALERAHRELTNVERLDTVIIDPSDVGLEKIGHFGYFSARNGPKLWPALVSRVAQMIE